jgi:hypothetical protein
VCIGDWCCTVDRIIAAVRYFISLSVGLFVALLLLDWFIQFTREPVSVLCDGGEGMNK